jgi:hypothetical protein
MVAAGTGVAEKVAVLPVPATGKERRGKVMLIFRRRCYRCAHLGRAMVKSVTREGKWVCSRPRDCDRRVMEVNNYYREEG